MSRILKDVVLLLICCSFTSAFLFAQSASSDRPNIIYILTDDLGIGDISLYNENGKIPTPNIDQLAKNGIKFNDAHTSSSVCTPTRYGILTGRYNWRSPLKQGVLTGKSKALIPSDRGTIASFLQENGYYTGFVGKWHLGWDWASLDDTLSAGAGWNPEDFERLDFSKKIENSPNDLGFDYAYGHSGSLDMAPYVYVENEKPTQIPKKSTVNKGKYSWWREGPTSEDFIHEQVTPHFFEKANAFIANAQETGKPFFLYLALPSPHTPILPLPQWQDKSGLNPYADFVMMIDDYIGGLVLELKQKGIWNNTMLVFTSDNGCSPAAKIEELTAKEHFPSYIYRGHKADIYEGGHRVPFILSWPQQIDSLRSSSKLICTTDFYATIADLLGIKLKVNEGEDSFSFLSEINSNQQRSEQRRSIIHHSINGSFAIRRGNWKLILCKGSGGWSYPKPNDSLALAELPTYQLYNLEDDPGEKTNLFYEKPQIVADLRSEFLRLVTNGRSTKGAVQSNDEGFEPWDQLEVLKDGQ